MGGNSCIFTTNTTAETYFVIGGDWNYLNDIAVMLRCFSMDPTSLGTLKASWKSQ